MSEFAHHFKYPLAADKGADRESLAVLQHIINAQINSQEQSYPPPEIKTQADFDVMKGDERENNGFQDHVTLVGSKGPTAM